MNIRRSFGYADLKFLMSRRIVIEFEKLRARVMNVHPGVLETNMNREATEAGFVVPCDDGEFYASLFLIFPEFVYMG